MHQAKSLGSNVAYGLLNDSLEELLKGLFDYAGMFPPAGLSFDDALRCSAAFPVVLHRPGLLGGDLVLDATKLQELTPAALSRAGFQRSPLRLCLLGAPLTPERPVIGAASGNAAVQIVSYEVKLPWPFPGFPDAAARALSTTRGALDKDIRLFVEPELSPSEWEKNHEAVFSLLDGLNRRILHPIGLKIRGSGPRAVTNAVLSSLLPDINRRSLPFKATGGLHHPFRNARKSHDLGFLNLAAALRLQSALGAVALPRHRLLECLETEGSAAYDFSGGLRWKEFSIAPEELRSAVSRVPFTIGSCSLSEPDEDLRRLFS